MSFNRWMDKEDLVHIYNGTLLSHQKGWKLILYIDMDGTGRYYAEQNKSIRERQLSYGFTYMWNIRNSMEDIRRSKGKLKEGKQKGTQTMRDYGFQETNWGFWRGGRWGERLAWWWVLRSARISWSTGYYMATMNHGTLHQKLMRYCMVTNVS